MGTTGSYVHNSMVKFSGGIPKMLVLCSFLKMLMVTDEMIHMAFRTHTTLYTKPIRENYNFHYLPNYTFALI